jgi:hypothetical protein
MLQIIILIVVSLVVVLIAITSIGKYKKIATSGTEAEGIVFDKELSLSANNNSASIFPVVRFLTHNNEWVTRKASVSVIPGSHKIGQKVTVIYLKDKPTEFFIKSSSTTTVLMIMIAGGLALFAYGVYLLINI